MYISHLLAQEFFDNVCLAGLCNAITQLRRKGLDFCDGHTLKALLCVAGPQVIAGYSPAKSATAIASMYSANRVRPIIAKASETAVP